jgi:hypothetical protein
MNSALMQIAQAKLAEMRETTARQAGRAGGRIGGLPAVTRAVGGPTAVSRPTPVRRTIGWFLVRVGLRLAVPRSFSASAR